MIVEVVTLRHIIKATLSSVIRPDEFEIWCDLDSDYWSIIRDNLKIKQLPDYQFFIGRNIVGNEAGSVPFTWLHVVIVQSKIEDTKLELPLVIKNTSPIDLSDDYYYKFYEYLENNPLAKTIFLRLGSPRDNYDLEGGHKIVQKNGGNPEAMEFYNRIKEFTAMTDVQFWYVTDIVHAEYLRERMAHRNDR